MTSASNGNAIVNKNILETGHLITLNSITPSYARMLSGGVTAGAHIVEERCSE